jgi:predicted HTH transcriptional regulator
MDMNGHELKKILAKGETLTVEFKSDVKGLPDRDLVAAIVAMANTEGGLIFLGVEDDGTVTGVQPAHAHTHTNDGRQLGTGPLYKGIQEENTKEITYRSLPDCLTVE